MVKCTPAVKIYNAMMGGVDVSDKMARLDKSRKAYRWYTCIDRKMTMLAIVNAFILCKAHRGSSIDLRTFALRVIHQLFGERRFRQKEGGRPRRVNRNSRTVQLKHESRLVDTSHFPARGQGKDHQCVVCGEKHKRYNKANGGNVKYSNNPHRRCKTTIMCKTCNVYLCSPQRGSCFVDFHSKVEFWR